ncbi:MULTISPECIES: ABC transporter ATP-binding protein [unclassified Butyrivibrio]|uniref:ABC transporter ATP-binding protein n=1 Tax=unclassified Butyrivibrio TaxID=2639466 RepID=UPI00047CA469|nr:MULTISPECIES: ABC transporter ATP-binding protein [unclassified Butyrivibrio]MDC7293276.1 ABC transporter ATP-binding protein [Butyrivibrio sp. DSM 10294]
MIDVQNVNFSYSKTPFLKDISFSVNKGEIFGFLGPSGAGKSTLQKVLTGICTNYEGSATILGVESKDHSKDFYEKIGVDFEFPSLFEKLTARENLKYFASLYSGEKRDIDELLREVGLYEHADKKVSAFSKGMKSRLNFIKSLVHDPEVLFLDEPTSGLDPNNSKIMKDLIRKEKEKGKTIILTTHNMQDATELCDRVVFIVNGQMKALDTPHNFIMSRGAVRVTYTYLENGVERTVSTILSNISCDEILRKLIEENRITSIHSAEPTLNDIFIEITGTHLD